MADDVKRREVVMAASIIPVMLGMGVGIEGAAAQGAPATTVLVTGASRGIGIEFVKQYAARGYNVIATARDPAKATELNALAAQHKNIRVERMDVLDHAGIDALAAKLKGTPIDILVNNAGIGGGGVNQNFGKINYAVFDEVMKTNVEGPLKVSEAFVEHVAASTQKKIMMVSSSQGSIASVRSASLYFYRTSKSALNMVSVNLAKALKERGIIVGMVAPGATDTDFMIEVRGRMPLGKPAERTAGMIAQIDAFTMDKTGQFFEWTGEQIPW
ncbi:MAG: SDR family oxidoreductase [Rhodospirillaceae bacterium]|nr:SDR family oxidoreductase [Rhodospirillaceae bacterium]